MLNHLSPVALSLLRVVAGFLFWQHGVQKLFGWFGGQAFPAFSLLWFAGLLESVGGPLIAIGLLTRPVAFVLAGEMLVAYFVGHAPRGPWPVRNGGVPALQFCCIFVHLAAVGPGSLAVDSFRSAKASWSHWLEKLAPVTLLILRVGSALLFWQYGASKFMGWFGGRRVPFFQLRWLAGVIEFFGAPLLALGLFTRLVAFLTSGEMAVAYWTSHFPRGTGFWPIQNGGEPGVLFCFIYLYLVTAGPGALSIDRWLLRKSKVRS